MAYIFVQSGKWYAAYLPWTYYFNFSVQTVTSKAVSTINWAGWWSQKFTNKCLYVRYKNISACMWAHMFSLLYRVKRTFRNVRDFSIGIHLESQKSHNRFSWVRVATFLRDNNCFDNLFDYQSLICFISIYVQKFEKGLEWF